MRMRFVYAVVALVVLLVPGISSADPVTDDLWDISNGSTVTGNSGVHNYFDVSDIRDMFGGEYSPVESGNTRFANQYIGGTGWTEVQEGYMHWVEWETPSAVTLDRFALYAQGDDELTPAGRKFKQFELFYKDGSTWTSIYDTGENYTYSGLLSLEVDVTDVTAQAFRAEFIQAARPAFPDVGTRIIELDGFGVVVPEPSSMTLAALGLLGLAFVGWRRRR